MARAAADAFFRLGWTQFAFDPSVGDWAAQAHVAGLSVLSDPDFDHWNQCEGTWFVGVDALPNDAAGRISGSAPLDGAAVRFIREYQGGWPPLHRGQLSVVRPGYPRPRKGESAAAFRYRRNRDAAHVDGILAQGPDRRRHVREPHAFVLGLPLNHASDGAAPLVVWEGSHEVMRARFSDAFRQRPPEQWGGVDVTDIYKDARRAVFATCTRREVLADPGEAILLHRLTLHGIAPWAANASAPPEGRMIAYFRPISTGSLENWLNLP